MAEQLLIAALAALTGAETACLLLVTWHRRRLSEQLAREQAERARILEFLLYRETWARPAWQAPVMPPPQPVLDAQPWR